MSFNGNSNVQNFKVTVGATPEVIEFQVGAEPSRIEIENQSTGAFGSWNDEMSDNSFFVKSAGGGAGGVGLKSANGVSVINNQENKSQGFSLGLLPDFNDEPGEVLTVSVWTSAK